MFEVGASTTFRAFHLMPDQPPPENERGMVCDLDVVTGSLADVADRVRDRDLSDVCGTEAVTVEILAAWIHAELAKPLGGDGAEAVSVRVWESADAFGGIRAPV